MASFKSCCNPCSRKSSSSTATMYCTDCAEGFCPDCVIAHSSFKAFESHHLIATGSDLGVVLSVQKLCSKHTKMTLDFFCAEHDCLSCLSCMTEDHRTCKNFIPLDDAAKGVKQSTMFEELSGTLSDIHGILGEMINYSDCSIKNLDDDETVAIKEIANIKENILKRLDKIESDIKVKLKHLKSDYKSKVESDKGRVLQLSKSVGNISSQINFATKYGSEKQIFILLHTLKLDISEHETRIHELLQSLENIRISFKQGEQAETTLDSLGSLKVECIPCEIRYKSPKITQAQDLPRTRHFLTKFNFDFNFDIKSTGNVWISSIAVTEDNRLLLCDCHTCSNKLLVYNDQGDYLQDCELSGEPGDIALLPGESEAVLTLPNELSVQFIDIKAMKADRIQSVPDAYGITVVNDQICVAGAGKISILDKQGAYLTTILVPGSSDIYYLHAGPQESIYYTDYSNDTVGCIKLNGEQCFTYSSESFKGPEAVTSDSKGNLYIVCKDSNNVHQLSSEGKFLDIILGQKNQMSAPFGISFNRDFRKLFVSNNDGNSIYVFSCS